MNKLTIKDLSYTYHNPSGDLKVLKNISAEFSAGTLYAIKGESGSGKTTFLSLISALDSVQSGDILYNDKSIKKIGNNNFRLNYVNIVFQSYNLIKYMTAAENVQVAIDFGANRSSSKKSRSAEYYLKQVGLSAEESGRLIGKLSGGQQQRVAIARTLASQVPVIVADEPTGNLDEETEEKIIKIFQDLAHKQEKIVIIVTHSKKVADHADKTLTLSRGKLS